MIFSRFLYRSFEPPYVFVVELFYFCFKGRKSFLGLFFSFSFVLMFFPNQMKIENSLKNIRRYFMNTYFYFFEKAFCLLNLNKTISFQSSMSNPLQSDCKKIVLLRDIYFVYLDSLKYIYVSTKKIYSFFVLFFDQKLD